MLHIYKASQCLNLKFKSMHVLCLPDNCFGKQYNQYVLKLEKKGVLGIKGNVLIYTARVMQLNNKASRKLLSCFQIGSMDYPLSSHISIEFHHVSVSSQLFSPRGVVFSD